MCFDYGHCSFCSQPNLPARQSAASHASRRCSITNSHNKDAGLKRGVPVEGVLTELIYLWESIVIPEGTFLTGKVSEYEGVDKTTRAQALLNGDVTPLHRPVISFNTIHSPGGDISIHSRAVVRDAQVVRFSGAGKRHGLMQQAKDEVKSRVHDAYDAILSPGKKDRALRLFYSQLPYHPQRIWPGTQFVADLTEPARFDVPAETPVPMAPSAAPTDSGIQVIARLTTFLNSDLARNGDTVTAVLSKPVFTPQHETAIPGRDGPSRYRIAGEAIEIFWSQWQAAFHLHGVTAQSGGGGTRPWHVDRGQR